MEWHISTLNLLFVKANDRLNVTRAGEHIDCSHLDGNITEDIHSGADGSGLNRLVIEDGKARIELASCPDGICSAHSPVFRNGESIVCLPNKVVVTVVAEKDTDSPDVIA